PLVLVDRVISGIDADTVIHDAYDGGRQVVQHLLVQGYRDIMFIGGLPRNSTIEARLDGCRDAMREAGLSLSVRLGRLDQACGEEIIASVRAEERVPEAIVAANNLVAVGAMAEMRRQHLSVPDDVGLACFGDIELASLLDPFLTVITQPAYEIGRIAMQILYDRINGADDPPRRHVLPVQLIPRRSTRRAPAPRP
ncbi:MAG: LacI family DNA-binding transcriptional regulator, partial [Longimicrobiales bacterium]